MIGYNQESKHTTGFNAGREQLISNDLGSLSYATGDRWVGSSDNSWATRSGFFRINYGYDERYLLEVNGRYDLSSNFPSTTVPYSTLRSLQPGDSLTKVGSRAGQTVSSTN